MNLMKRNIAFAACLAIFAAATWYAFKPPSAPPLAASILDDPAATTTVTTATGVATAVAANTPPSDPAKAPSKAPAKIVIEITSPISNAAWTIGEQNMISWNKAAGSIGQIYLVNAASGVIAGWIEQEISPAQTFFPWNTLDIFLSKTDPLTKNITPGEYFIKITFLSPHVESAVSAPFWIVAPPSH